MRMRFSRRFLRLLDESRLFSAASEGNPSLSSKPAGAPFGSGVPPLPPPTHPAYRAPTSKAGNKWILHPNLPIDVRFLTVWTVVMSFAAWSMYDELQARSHQREVKKAEERERMKELMAAKTEVRHLGSEVRHLKDEIATRAPDAAAAPDAPAPVAAVKQEGKKSSWRSVEEDAPSAPPVAAALVNEAPSSSPPDVAQAGDTRADEGATASTSAPAPAVDPEAARLVTEVLSEALTLDRSIAEDKVSVLSKPLPTSDGLSLSAAQLLERALQRGHEADPRSLVQAQMDAEAIEALVARIEARHRAALAARDERAAALEALVDKSRAAVLSLRDRFREALGKSREEMAAGHREDLAREVHRVRSELQAALNQAAVERLSAIDQLRTQVNALSKAFSLRSDERMQSHTAHRITTGVLALTTALETGRPFVGELAVLKRAARASSDPLLQAAVLSLEASLAAVDEGLGLPAAVRGLPTLPQLMDRFADVRRAAVTLAVLPEGQTPGILTYGLARLASMLKVSERASVLLVSSATSAAPDTPGLGGGVDGAMARAERLLVEGRISEAAQLVEGVTRHTAAHVAVGPWLEGLKARAMADQTVELLKAHATCLSASLS